MSQVKGWHIWDCWIIYIEVLYWFIERLSALSTSSYERCLPLGEMSESLDLTSLCTNRNPQKKTREKWVDLVCPCYASISWIKSSSFWKAWLEMTTWRDWNDGRRLTRNGRRGLRRRIPPTAADAGQRRKSGLRVSERLTGAVWISNGQGCLSPHSLTVNDFDAEFKMAMGLENKWAVSPSLYYKTGPRSPGSHYRLSLWTPSERYACLSLIQLFTKPFCI